MVLALQHGRAEPGADPLQLAVGHPLGRHPVELLVDRCDDPVGGDVTAVVGLHQEGRGVAHVERVLHEGEVGTDVAGDPVLLHKSAAQPGRVAGREHRAEDDERQVGVEVVRVGDPPAECHRRGRRERVDVLVAALGGRRRLVEVGALRDGTARDVGEVRLHQGHRLVGVEVAADRENGVARRVVAVEEVAGVLDRRALQVLEPAVAVVGVGERLEQQRRQRQPREAAVRLVQDVDPDLLLHHRDLVGEVLLVHGGRTHPVGLEEQRALEGVRRQRLVVVRVVETGGAVQGAAGGLHVLDVVHLSQRRRALEHQVLEEVGEPGASLGLRPDADVVVDSDCHHRGRPVRCEHDAQAVAQGGAFDGVRRGGWCDSSSHAGDRTRPGHGQAGRPSQRARPMSTREPSGRSGVASARRWSRNACSLPRGGDPSE